MSVRLLAALAATALAVATPSVGLTADETLAQPIFDQRAKPQDVAEAYPKAAFAEKVSGDVDLDCTADASGRLSDCKVTSEEPAGRGFGAAALALSAKERVKAKDAAGVPIAGRRFERTYSFLAPGDSNADWMAKPTAAQLLGVYPVAARRKPPANARATIACKVNVEGFLRDCKVVQQVPENMGFGAAALQLSSLFRMKPKIRNGKPKETEVTIPVVWSGFENMPQPAGPANTLVLDPPWASTPSSAQVRAAWPADAKGATTGQVVLRCDLNKTGGLTSCEVHSELPAGKGFGKAARSLAPAFKVSFQPDQVKTLGDYTVDVPFHFRDPTGPDNRKITAPKWIRTLTPEGMALVYPQAAMKAGVNTGLGVVACVVDTQGALTDCQVRREEPAGLDFGAAAMEAVKLMTMNPWSKEGEPLDGLPIVLPIRFNWQPDPAPPPVAAKP
ncbi:TonB family protein [Caulobacter sp. CCG-8]|uniref:TonB family protein n=1 Tax=Caulobacter sp. CCG-8 TaxID=3127958 RepID=UPI00307CF5CC